MGECNLQIALVGTVGMRVTLRQRGRKDYALLNAEWMMYISFVINAFKFFFGVINAYKMFLCTFFYFIIIKFFLGFLVWHWFFECGASWSLEAPSDGNLFWLLLSGWSRSRPESQPLEIL